MLPKNENTLETSVALESITQHASAFSAATLMTLSFVPRAHVSVLGELIDRRPRGSPQNQGAARICNRTVVDLEDISLLRQCLLHENFSFEFWIYNTLYCELACSVGS